jgi:glycosyltransferase involved in cell wall biosynthesis
MTNVLLFVPRLGQPRIKKRIVYFLERGWGVRVYSYRRSFAEILNDISDEFAGAIEKGTLEIIDLGEISNGDYFARLFKILFTAWKLLTQERENFEKSDLIYLSGHDFAILFYFIYRSKVRILEIADVTYLNSENEWVHRFFKRIEKAVFPSYKAIILTSKGFQKYYEAFIPSFKDWFIVENKLHKEVLNFLAEEKVASNNKINIGYLGYIRYEEHVTKFIHAVGKRPNDFNFYMYGDSVFKEKLLKLSATYSNIFFRGVFSNPYDLPRIYSEIDLTYAVYKLGRNEEIAEPNKLYEAIFYNTPILAQKNTFLAEKVEFENTGFVIDVGDEESIEGFLDSINLEMLEAYKEKVKVPRSSAIDNGDQLDEVIAFLDINLENNK